MSEEISTESLNPKTEADHAAQVDRVGAKLQARFRKLSQTEEKLGFTYPNLKEVGATGTKIDIESTSQGGIDPLSYEGGSTLVHNVDSHDPQKGYSGNLDRLIRNPKHALMAGETRSQTSVSRQEYGAENGFEASNDKITKVTANAERGTLTGTIERRPGDGSEVTNLTPAEAAQSAAAIYGNMRNGLVEREKAVQAEQEARRKAA